MLEGDVAEIREKFPVSDLQNEYLAHVISLRTSKSNR